MADLTYDEIVAASKWRVGQETWRGDQRFACIGFVPYDRIDGRVTALAELESECPTCSARFTVQVAAFINPERVSLTRRCPRHAKVGGRLSKKVKRVLKLRREAYEKNAASIFD